MSDPAPTTVVGPDGRSVELTAERWAHITDGHPELTSFRDEVLETVRAPDRRLAGRIPGEAWFYKGNAGPSQWLKVVVRYESSGRGWIVTAFSETRAMSITVGHTTFDRVRYDSDADILYLHVGEPSQAVDFDESPEGHALRFNADGDLVGLTIVNAKRLLDDTAPIVVTIPERVTIDPATLAPAVC